MACKIVIGFVWSVLLFNVIVCEKEEDKGRDLIIVTVATNETDGYRRLVDSARHYNLHLETLGLGTVWQGGDMNKPGGGYKINLVKQYLQDLFPTGLEPSLQSTVVLFLDAYDTMLLGDEHEILDRFDSLEAGIVFSAEVYCWPDKDLAHKYPQTESPYKYLNSGGYIGVARDLYHLLTDHPLENKDDDQLYLTKLFLDTSLREKYHMRLDTRASLFQNLHGASDDVTLRQDEETENKQVVLVNTRFDTSPLVLHGNGLSKLTLNSLGNYLAGSWHPVTGCRDCRQILSPQQQETEREDAMVLLAVFITSKTPFLQEFFHKISRLDYPKARLHLFLYNSVEYHEGLVDEFISNYGADYVSVKRIRPRDSIYERQARYFTLERCLWKKCSYLFAVDSVAHVDSPHILKALIASNNAYVHEEQRNVR